MTVKTTAKTRTLRYTNKKVNDINVFRFLNASRMRVDAKKIIDEYRNKEVSKENLQRLFDELKNVNVKLTYTPPSEVRKRSVKKTSAKKSEAKKSEAKKKERRNEDETITYNDEVFYVLPDSIRAYENRLVILTQEREVQEDNSTKKLKSPEQILCEVTYVSKRTAHLVNLETEDIFIFPVEYLNLRHVYLYNDEDFTFDTESEILATLTFVEDAKQREKRLKRNKK